MKAISSRFYAAKRVGHASMAMKLDICSHTDGAMQVEAAERLSHERRKLPGTKTGTLRCQFGVSVPSDLC